MTVRGIKFLYVHDLAKLLAMLEQHGEHVSPEIRQAEWLSQYAYETRYPGTFEPVTQAEYEIAISLAETVVTWATAIIRQTYPDYT